MVIILVDSRSRVGDENKFCRDVRSMKEGQVNGSIIRI